jgi:hypothetical protein
VILVADRPGGEALAEEGSDPVVDGVVLAGVGAVRRMQRPGEVLDAARDDRVVVRAHQAVGVEGNRLAAEGVLEQGQEEQAVGVGPEQHRLVHGIRGDVEEAVGERRPENASHGLHATAAEAP